MSTVLLRIANPALPGQDLYGACRKADLLRTTLDAAGQGCWVRVRPWSDLPGAEILVSPCRLDTDAAATGPGVLRVTTLGIAAGGRWLCWQLPGDPPPVPG